MSDQRPSAASTLTTGLVAGIGYAAFYAAGSASQSQFFQRYFCGHPLEYVSTAMFFAGMSILLLKYWGLRAENKAVTLAQSLRQPGSAKEAAELWPEQFGKPLYRTQMARRVREAVQYLRGTRRDGLEEHLRYLAELASDRLHQTYATIRTITWAIPILGFLGTVIGITMAIAKVTPEQLDTSLGAVTHGLSVAFDTTALALGMSIVLVFSSFVVERSEQKILVEVEQFGIDTLLPELAARESEPAIAQVRDPIQALASGPEQWEEQLTEIRSVWTNLIQQHAGELKTALETETVRSLQVHQENCDDARDSYTAAIQHVTDSVVGQFDRLLATLDTRMNAWQEAMQCSTQASVRQSESLHELGATLLRLTESGQQLQGLQQQLNENLQALQVAETMDRTANSLAAAVHVLTAKASARNAA